MDYEINIKEIIEQIKAARAKRVLLQLPDGLKPRAGELASEIEKKSGAEVIIWAGSNFGGCDVPNVPKSLRVDLVINVGHAEYK